MVLRQLQKINSPSLLCTRFGFKLNATINSIVACVASVSGGAKCASRNMPTDLQMHSLKSINPWHGFTDSQRLVRPGKRQIDTACWIWKQNIMGAKFEIRIARGSHGGNALTEWLPRGATLVLTNGMCNFEIGWTTLATTHNLATLSQQFGWTTCTCDPVCYYNILDASTLNSANAKGAKTQQTPSVHKHKIEIAKPEMARTNTITISCVECLSAKRNNMQQQQT